MIGLNARTELNQTEQNLIPLRLQVIDGAPDTRRAPVNLGLDTRYARAIARAIASTHSIAYLEGSKLIEVRYGTV